MAQLESGKIYIVDNVGVKNYTNEPSYHTVPEYFTWLSNKIATGLGIEIQPIIKDNQNCCLPLPYINDPTENRLCLCLRGITLATGLVFKIGYFNGNDYHIGNDIELPYIMYSNQSMSIKYKNSSTYTYYPYNSVALFPSETGSFVIDTRFLESNGFYTMAFLANTTNEIDEVAVSPRVFICDMVDVLTEKHYDGLFTLPNTTGSYTYEGGYVPSSSGYQSLGAPSIAAIGVDKDGKYSLQGYYPQIFASDYSSAGTRTQETLISASMIRVQFGRLRTAHDIYLTIGNSTENLMDCCGVKNIKDNHIDWNENVLKINNKKYSLSCNCERDLFNDGNPQWAVVIKDKEENKPKAKGYIEVINAGPYTITFSMSNKVWEGIIEYSLDEGKTWATWSKKDPETRVVLKEGKNVYLRGTGNTRMSSMESDGCFHTSDNFTKIRVRGNMEALLDYKTVQKGKHPPMKEWCFHQFFRLVGYALIEAPDLPAIKLSKNCYERMFNGCYLLEKAPALPAIELADNCYNTMFLNCSSLKEASELPATTLANYCYFGMFSGCRSLKEVPDLPATTLATRCYSNMFVYCTSLTKIHDVLPATKLEEGCYMSLYYGCTSLVEINENLLPATTLAKNCYRSMFSECTSLTKVTKLPATKLADYCYYYMFNNTKVTQVSKLPATKLVQYCYDHMFCRCSELELSAIKTDKYKYDFRIPTSGTGTSATNATNVMFYGTKTTPAYSPSINTTYYVEKEPV